MLLLDKIWHQSRISTAVKFHLYSCCILSVLLYRCEKWSQQDGQNWSHFTCVANDPLWTSYGQTMCTSLTSMKPPINLSSQQLYASETLFGHITKCPDSVPVKAVHLSACNICKRIPPTPDWGRPQGRLPTTWLHVVGNTQLLAAKHPLMLIPFSHFMQWYNGKYCRNQCYNGNCLPKTWFNTIFFWKAVVLQTSHDTLTPPLVNIRVH